MLKTFTSLTSDDEKVKAEAARDALSAIAGPVLQDTYDILQHRLLECFSDALMEAYKWYPGLLEPAIFGYDTDRMIWLYRRIDYRHYISSGGNLYEVDLCNKEFYETGIIGSAAAKVTEDNYVTFNAIRSVCFGYTTELLVDVFCPRLRSVDRLDQITNPRALILDFFQAFDFDPRLQIAGTGVQAEVDTVMDDIVTVYGDNVRLALYNAAKAGGFVKDVRSNAPLASSSSV